MISPSGAFSPAVAASAWASASAFAAAVSSGAGTGASWARAALGQIAKASEVTLANASKFLMSGKTKSLPALGGILRVKAKTRLRCCASNYRNRDIVDWHSGQFLVRYLRVYVSRSAR